MRCELCCSDCNNEFAVEVDCGILSVNEFDAANDSTIMGAAARQHTISAAPVQLYFIIVGIIVVSFSDTEPSKSKSVLAYQNFSGYNAATNSYEFLHMSITPIT